MERARALPHQRSLTSELPQAGWRWSRMTWLITFASWPRRAWLLLRLVSLCETALACHRWRQWPATTSWESWRRSGVAPSLPEDLYYLIKKAVSVRKHLDKNRKDKDAKFRLILVESRIHRLARYYKRVKSLPATFKYQSSTASALVAWVRLVVLSVPLPDDLFSADHSLERNACWNFGTTQTIPSSGISINPQEIPPKDMNMSCDMEIGPSQQENAFCFPLEHQEDQRSCSKSSFTLRDFRQGSNFKCICLKWFPLQFLNTFIYFLMDQGFYRESPPLIAFLMVGFRRSNLCEVQLFSHYQTPRKEHETWRCRMGKRLSSQKNIHVHEASMLLVTIFVQFSTCLFAETVGRVIFFLKICMRHDIACHVSLLQAGGVEVLLRELSREPYMESYGKYHLKRQCISS